MGLPQKNVKKKWIMPQMNPQNIPLKGKMQ
jgi:hypothetical protein